MKLFFYLSLFATVFLTLIIILTLNRKSNEDMGKSSSLLQLLKSWNSQLKSLLMSKKRPKKKNEKLANRINVAGLPIKPEELIAFQWMSALITAGILYLLTSHIILALAGLITGYAIPHIWLRKKEQKRVKQFNEDLPNMLTSIISSLRAGFSFVQSLQLVAKEANSPIKEEVEILLKSMQYGTSLEDAMLEWKNRIPSNDLSLLVEAILIQRQVGGNLAYLLEKIVETTRERKKLQNQVKSLTAQGKLSGIVISALPVALGVIIYIINPEYIMTLFYNPIGRILVGAALIGAIIGFISVRKITTIEV
ncbi:tight adherence protein B [Gracilibacillus ureilyticus]|uniref:Tight adherence protein B n=1 Tax=Gracilibacillus ureilyticus TaxID=531814 RepID=A0A1H9V4U8_9BACI|nr:type II secretion system F family protein [Gracilibacillus ureilyticus]SES16702.1 tight adherence protein B [Gracilibacillus ureilyticus]